MRYRLRFHLQEIDLTSDEVVIGRGSACHVTIDDPMLSRTHVRIVLGGPQPFLEDLHSRNGTQLNGRPVDGRAMLEDGDRIRIGAQELVFLVPSRVRKDFRTTSGLTFCIGCAVPYPSSSPQCPHCGAVRTVEADPARASEKGDSGWTFHLLAQVVDRALGNGRLADAERMLSRGVSELDEQVEAGIEVDSARIAELAECAARLGCRLQSARWLGIATRLYVLSGHSASPEVAVELDALQSEGELERAREALSLAAGARRVG